MARNRYPEDPCQCGSEEFDVTATMIACTGCSRVWGRVNGAWVLDFTSVPAPLQDADDQRGGR